MPAAVTITLKEVGRRLVGLRLIKQHINGLKKCEGYEPGSLGELGGVIYGVGHCKDEHPDSQRDWCGPCRLRRIWKKRQRAQAKRVTGAVTCVLIRIKKEGGDDGR